MRELLEALRPGDIMPVTGLTEYRILQLETGGFKVFESRNDPDEHITYKPLDYYA